MTSDIEEAPGRSRSQTWDRHGKPLRNDRNGGFDWTNIYKYHLISIIYIYNINGGFSSDLLTCLISGGTYQRVIND